MISDYIIEGRYISDYLDRWYIRRRKTTISWKIKENFQIVTSNFRFRYYFEKMIQEIMEKAALNRAFPSIGGVSPQTNKNFLLFRELIQKKSKNAKRILIVSIGSNQ